MVKAKGKKLECYNRMKDIIGKMKLGNDDVLET